MMKSTRPQRKWLARLGISLLVLLLLASAAQNVYYAFWGFDSYLQSTDEIYVMESGILQRHPEMMPGEDHYFTYDFEHPDYAGLLDKYAIAQTAGDGTQLERALRLMNAYSSRLTHLSNYDNHVDINALALLEYSLDKPEHGINCRAKAQILNEMCLALGIHARKVWIMPYSVYDTDCHVVNEVWDSTLNKWVMLDITNNLYWVDDKGTPLSVLEIRDKGASQEFCTPLEPGQATANLQALKDENIGNFLYIMKNMVYMEYCSQYTVGEVGPFLRLSPQTLTSQWRTQISRQACERSPLEMQP